MRHNVDYMEESQEILHLVLIIQKRGTLIISYNLYIEYAQNKVPRRIDRFLYNNLTHAIKPV